MEQNEFCWMAMGVKEKNIKQINRLDVQRNKTKLNG